MSKALRISGGMLAAMVGFGWAGLQVNPAPFPSVPQPSAAFDTMPLPSGLPAPVARFYRQIYGERVPVIQTAVISGRGTMRPVGGVTFPARFRFTHTAGYAYRHYFETTVFGQPIMRVNEYYVNGEGRMELPWGVEAGPNIDQAANLSLWGEIAAWLPAVLLTDSRVRWEAMDDTTAQLVVPFGADEQRFVARFDSATGKLHMLESMRYKSSGETKTLWLNTMERWDSLGGLLLPTSNTVTWLDDGTPWLRFTIEDVAYNVPVDTSLDVKGP